jgi:glycosyltransferase involved in cell wall biosynthesis
MTPRVSVVMSVYNGETYLQEAVESILSQTFNDFEFIVIDDGSFDSTPRLLARYEQRDPRVLIYRFEGNRGLSTSLNFGIERARGEYIARMDADDVSLPNRLQEQVSFMDAHPEISVCGSWVELIGMKNGGEWKYPASHEAIYARTLFENTLVHSSIIIRVSLFKKYALAYDESVRYAQDYELWSRTVALTRFANVDQVLLRYRIHGQGAGSKHREEQLRVHEIIYRRLLQPFEVELTRVNLLTHQTLAVYQSGNAEFLRNARHWLESLSGANRKVRILPLRVLDSQISLYWSHACMACSAPPSFVFKQVVSSSLHFQDTAGFRKLWRALCFYFDRITGR